MTKKITYCNNFNWILAFIVGMLGYKLNSDSVFWGVIDGIFYPIVLIKWLICEQLNITLIGNTFPFFFK